MADDPHNLDQIQATRENLATLASVVIAIIGSTRIRGPRWAKVGENCPQTANWNNRHNRSDRCVQSGRNYPLVMFR